METTIIVSYDAGWGNAITIRGGEPFSWDKGASMESAGTNTWRLQLDLEHPVDFKPCLNDELWAFGRKDYHLQPGQTLQIYPHFFESPGWADAIGYIPFKGRDVTVRLYSPPGYKENAQRRYPVLYSLNGRTLFEGPGLSRLEETMNLLIEARAVEPLLLVGVDFVEGDSEAGALDKATEFGPFVMNLKQTIDRNYPTLADAANSGVMGCAQAGLLALWLGRRHPQTFGRVAALAPSFSWAQPELLAQIPVSVQHEQQRVYLDAEDSHSEPVRAVANSMTAEGWVQGTNLLCDLLPSGEGGCLNRIGAPLRFLFPWSGR
jgi:predicted alpha/beta superfamily hydrolase